MIGLFLLLLLSIYGFFTAYQALRYKRGYWYGPTISGYKRRKEPTNNGSPQVVGIFIGISSLLPFFLFLRGCIDIIK